MLNQSRFYIWTFGLGPTEYNQSMINKYLLEFGLNHNLHPLETYNWSQERKGKVMYVFKNIISN